MSKLGICVDKQKTADDMPIRDLSSNVCASDLRTGQEDAPKSLVHHRAADGVADAQLFRPADAVDSQTDHERRAGVRRRSLFVADLLVHAALYRHVRREDRKSTRLNSSH